MLKGGKDDDVENLTASSWLLCASQGLLIKAWNCPAGALWTSFHTVSMRGLVRER